MNTPGEKKRSYSFIVLVSISMMLSVLTFFAGQREENLNNHKFCQLIQTSLEHPAPRPADPKKDPSREHSYQVYQEVVQLSRGLGCTE